MISQLRTNSLGAQQKAQINQLFSLTKHHAKVSLLIFSNAPSERDWTHQNLTKKEGNFKLSSLLC